MGRPPCCDKSNVKRGLWTAEEDAKILAYVSSHGVGDWTLVPKRAGLNRCGKSCRLRWVNYLRPDLKHDSFTPQEEQLIIDLHKAIGSRWSLIAKRLPGRTDNDVKNYWNTKLRKKLTKMGVDPVTHKPFSQVFSDYGTLSSLTNAKNPIKSLLKNLNNTTISKPESSSSVIGGLSSTKMTLKPVLVQDNNISTANNYSIGFLDQFHDSNQDTFHAHCNELASSCSSSSSVTFTKLASRKSSVCQPITPTSPFTWSEFLLSDPIVSTDFHQLQQDREFQGMLSSASSSTLTQNEISMLRESNPSSCRVVSAGSGACDHGVNRINQSSNPLDDASSTASSFVDAILDRDSKMRSQFYGLLDGFLDY